MSYFAKLSFVIGKSRFDLTIRPAHLYLQHKNMVWYFQNLFYFFRNVQHIFSSEKYKIVVHLILFVFLLYLVVPYLVSFSTSLLAKIVYYRKQFRSLPSTGEFSARASPPVNYSNAQLCNCIVRIYVTVTRSVFAATVAKPESN